MKITDLTGHNFYDVTPSVNVPRILKNGLIPNLGLRSAKIEKGQNKIFLFKSVDDAEDAVMNWLGDEFPEDTDLTLLKVTLPSTFPITHDPVAGFEISTSNKIPPEMISV